VAVVTEGDGSSFNGARPDASPFGEEAQRLLSAVQDWAQRAMPAPPSGHPGPECQWCPLCQLASVLRGEHPELAERLVEAGTAVAGALRAVLDSASRHAPTQRPEATQHPETRKHPETPPRRPYPSPHVERIRLDDDDPPDAPSPT
jgi:hypothetical protein